MSSADPVVIGAPSAQSSRSLPRPGGAPRHRGTASGSACPGQRDRDGQVDAIRRPASTGRSRVLSLSRARATGSGLFPSPLWGGVRGGGGANDTPTCTRGQRRANLRRCVIGPWSYQIACEHREMRAAPTEAEKKLRWHLRHRLRTEASHFRRHGSARRLTAADFDAPWRSSRCRGRRRTTWRARRRRRACAPDFSKARVTEFAASGTTTCCEISMACWRSFGTQ